MHGPIFERPRPHVLGRVRAALAQRQILEHVACLDLVLVMDQVPRRNDLTRVLPPDEVMLVDVPAGCSAD